MRWRALGDRALEPLARAGRADGVRRQPRRRARRSAIAVISAVTTAAGHTRRPHPSPIWRTRKSWRRARSRIPLCKSNRSSRSSPPPRSPGRRLRPSACSGGPNMRPTTLVGADTRLRLEHVGRRARAPCAPPTCTDAPGRRRRPVGGTINAANAAAPIPTATAANTRDRSCDAPAARKDTRLVGFAPEATEDDDPDRREAGAEEQRHDAATRLVERAKRARARGERDEHQPRQARRRRAR